MDSNQKIARMGQPVILPENVTLVDETGQEDTAPLSLYSMPYILTAGAPLGWVDYHVPTTRRYSKRVMNARLTGVRTQPKVGRNDTCPCASGKKYKYCCLKS